MKALDYASQFTTITQQDRHIITHAIKSLLYRQQLSRTKKNTDNMFDVIMGSYDGAACELIGTYMLSLITAKIKDQVGLYRDDGLAVCKAMPRQIEKIKQQISNLLTSNGLKQKKNSSFLRRNLRPHKLNLQTIYETQQQRQQTTIRPSIEQPSPTTTKEHPRKQKTDKHLIQPKSSVSTKPYPRTKKRREYAREKAKETAPGTIPHGPPASKPT